MLEIESLNSVVADGHSEGDEGTSGGTFPSQSMYRTAIEVTYGLTDKIEFAAYINLAKPPAAPIQYAGSNFRSPRKPLRTGTAVGRPRGGTWSSNGTRCRPSTRATELELKPIIQKDWGPVEVDLNPKFEKVLVGPSPARASSSATSSGSTTTCHELSPGLEFYGAIGQMSDVEPLNEQQHYIFPSSAASFPTFWNTASGPASV